MSEILIEVLQKVTPEQRALLLAWYPLSVLETAATNTAGDAKIFVSYVSNAPTGNGAAYDSILALTLKNSLT